MGTCTILHKNTIVPVAKAGEKKAKNLKVGDAVLCERGEGVASLNPLGQGLKESLSCAEEKREFFLSRITSIETEMHSSWWKTDEGIFASDAFGGTPYHVASKAYIIKLDGENRSDELNPLIALSGSFAGKLENVPFIRISNT